MSSLLDWEAKLALVGKKMTQQNAPSSVIVAQTKTQNLVLMWPEGAAAMPTELGRTSLFGMPQDQPGPREKVEGVLLNSRSDLKAIYSGQRLDAKDETAWLAVLRIGRGVPMGERIYTSKVMLLKEIGLTNTGPNWSALKARLNRLTEAHLDITFKRKGKTYEVHTGLMSWGEEVETGAVYIRLNPEGADLFGNLAYQTWELRLSLHSDVSARLLSYVTGHQQGKPHSVLVDDLRRWCGYEGVLRKFRTRCAIALAELEAQGVLVQGSATIVQKSRGWVATWVRAHSARLPPQARDAAE